MDCLFRLMGRLSVDRRLILFICVIYVLATCFFIIAYRKHYSVDLMVGFFIAALMSAPPPCVMRSAIVFRDGWSFSLDPLEPSYEPLSTEVSI